MEWESDSPCRSHTFPGQGCKSAGRGSGWELESRDCGEIPGRGLLFNAERPIKGMWGRRLWWERPVEESQAAMEARPDTAESRVGGGAITVASLSPPASICRWTIERLAHRTPEALNYRVGPHAGCPFKCLMRPSTEKDPTKAAPLSAWCAHLQRRTPVRGSPLCAWRAKQQTRTPDKGALEVPEWAKLRRKTSQRDLEKDFTRAMTPAAEAVHIPAQLVLLGSPQAKQLHHLYAQLSLGQSCRR